MKFYITEKGAALLAAIESGLFDNTHHQIETFNVFWSLYQEKLSKCRKGSLEDPGKMFDDKPNKKDCNISKYTSCRYFVLIASLFFCFGAFFVCIFD